VDLKDVIKSSCVGGGGSNQFAGRNEIAGNGNAGNSNVAPGVVHVTDDTSGEWVEGEFQKELLVGNDDSRFVGRGGISISSGVTVPGLDAEVQEEVGSLEVSEEGDSLSEGRGAEDGGSDQWGLVF
jgi:hypothetical protein